MKKPKHRKLSMTTESDRHFLSEVQHYLATSRNAREEAEGFASMIRHPYYKGLANRELEEG